MSRWTSNTFEEVGRGPGARGELASRGEGVVLPHTKVHHGFRIERDAGGRWHTYRPDGTEILIGPGLS